MTFIGASMKINDIELLERITAKHKYRYETLDSCFEKTTANKIIYVPINITLLLTELKQFGDSLYDNKDFNLHCAIAVMNLFAHYKHYYMNHQASKVIIIGFVKDNYQYKQFHGIITIIENLCEFFPHVYFMGNVAPIKHTILVAAYINYLHSVTLSGLDSCLHVYSSFNIDKQLLCIIPAKESYKICKLMNTSKVDFLSKNQFIYKLFKDNKEAFETVDAFKPEIERLSVIIGAFLGSYECTSSSEKEHFTFSFIRENVKKRALRVLEFFTLHYNKESSDVNINEQFINFLSSYLTNPLDIASLKNYANRYDYFSHEGQYLYRFMREIHNSNRVKIKDYEMAKETEKYRLLIEHQLYANWLLF
jgi:hypothetical protein